jgi:hypothetical protein
VPAVVCVSVPAWSDGSALSSDQAAVSGSRARVSAGPGPPAPAVPNDNAIRMMGTFGMLGVPMSVPEVNEWRG